MDLSKPRCYSQGLLLPSLATGKPKVRILYSTFNNNAFIGDNPLDGLAPVIDTLARAQDGTAGSNPL